MTKGLFQILLTFFGLSFCAKSFWISPQHCIASFSPCINVSQGRFAIIVLSNGMQITVKTMVMALCNRKGWISFFPIVSNTTLSSLSILLFFPFLYLFLPLFIFFFCLFFLLSFSLSFSLSLFLSFFLYLFVYIYIIFIL